MERLYVYLQSRRRALEREDSNATSEPGPGRLTSGDVDEAHSPEGFCMSDPELDTAATGANTSQPAPQALAPAAPGSSQDCWMKPQDWIMHKDRALEVKEVCHVAGQTMYECMYIPPLKGLMSLLFAVFHKDIRKLTSEEVQKVQAQINLEGGESKSRVWVEAREVDVAAVVAKPWTRHLN